MKAKQILSVFTLVVISSLIGYRLGLSQVGETLKSVVEAGSMATEASYIIFTDGNGNYYARNGLTGEIEFQGTDAAQVIQSAIDSISTGHIHIKDGTYVLSTSLKLPNNRRYLITGSGYGTHLVSRGEGVFEITDSGSYPFWGSQLTIKDMRIEAKTGFGVKCDFPKRVPQKCPWLVLQNMYIYAKYGIKLNTPYRSRVENVHIQCDNEVSGGIGIWLYQEEPWFHSGDSFFGSIYVNMDGPNAIGLLIDASLASDGTINLITFDKMMLYGRSDSTGIYLKANNASAGNIAMIHFEGIDLEGWGTNIRLEGAPPPNVRGDIYSIYIQGEYWGGTTCVNATGAVTGVTIHDANFACSNDLDTSNMYGWMVLYDCFKWGSWNVNLNERTYFHHCKGYLTENWGTVTIRPGSFSVSFEHRLASTPSIVVLGPKGSLQGLRWDANETHITLSVDIAPSTATEVSWYARV